MKKILLILFMFLILISRTNAIVDLTPNSASSILIEASTGKILYEKDAYKKMSPASMTKIMTLLLTMEALENERISLEDQVYISQNASGMGGTQIFVEQNTYVTVENLVKGIGIASANDAAVAMAEHIYGSEDVFVEKMNERARQLGCKNTNFMNPHGLDEENHYTTAYDMSLIARELVKYDYAIEITSTYEDYINVSGENHWLVNTNKLVKFYEGLDGLKTGYTDNALYCLTATMKKNDMRLISVVMKSDTKDNRSKDTISLLEYGFSMYGSKTILNKEEYKGNTIISNATKKEIQYYLKDDVKIIVDKDTRDVKYKIEEKLDNVKAPLEANSKIGTLYLNVDDAKYEYDLIVKEKIEKANYIECVFNLLKDLISGKINTIFL